VAEQPLGLGLACWLRKGLWMVGTI
jgi:hypothetical protein